MTQVIRTVLETDASRAVAGFAAGEKAVTGYERALTSAQRAEGGRRNNSVFDDVPASADKAQGAITRLSGSIRDNRKEWDELSSKAMVGGAAIVGGLGLAAKAAIDWESAWAGVAKTVDGTDEQMAELEDGLRGLARELPATHAEIAGVAEAAGQLGVAREDILGFTETAIALGESTNLSAEEAATNLAQFSNIMGTVAREGVEGYEKLGSTLVELGNNGASTEKQIMDMGLRLAGAGQQIGATEADILAMANALSSVGIEAELGGGAMSRGLLQMNSAVIEGGDKLEKFAQIAGMTASEFAAKWRADPISAANEFVAGLGRIGDSGGDAAGALADVGLKGTQNAQVFLRAAGASDLMTESLEMGASAWEANTALQEEAAKRYETDAARIQTALNRIKDAAISFGSSIAPILASGAEKVAGLADAFGRLPGPVQSFLGGLAGVTGATLLLGGAAVKAIGFAQDMGDALNTVTGRSGEAAGALDKANFSAAGVAKWGGYALGAVAAANAIGQLIESTKAAPAGLEETKSALIDLSSAGDGSAKGINQFFRDLDDGGNLLGNFNVKVDGLSDAFRRMENPSAREQFLDWKNDIFPGLSSEAEQLEDGFARIGESLAAMPADQAASAFDGMVESIGGGEKTAKRLLELMPAYREQLKGSENDARMAGEGADAMGGDLEGMGDSAEAAGKAVDDLSDAISGLGSTFLDERQAARDYQEALQTMRDSISENGSAWGTASEAGRANMEALEGIAEAARDSAAAIIENKGSVEDAEAALAKGREDVDKFAGSLNVGSSEVKDLKDNVLQLPDEAKIEFETTGAGAAVSQATQLGLALGGVGTSASGAKTNVLDLDASIKTLDGKTVTVEEAGADASQIRVRELDGALIGLPAGKTVQVQEIGSTKAGEMVVQFKDKVYAIPASKTAQIRQSGAEGARAKVLGFNDSIKLLNGKTVKVGEDGAQQATGRVRTMDGAIFGLKDKTVKVEEIGATASGDRVFNLDGKIYALNGKAVDVRANVHGLWDVGALAGSIAGLQSKTVTVTAITKKIASSMHADGGIMESAGGGLHQTFADGGFAGRIGSQQPQIRRAGGEGILWAEEGAGPWEAFISGHPAKSARSKQIWLETGRRLGMVEAHADGGVRQHANRTYVTPQPRVTVQAPAQASAAIDSRAIGAAVAAQVGAELRGWQPMVQIGDRRFFGQLQRTTANRKGR